MDSEKNIKDNSNSKDIVRDNNEIGPAHIREAFEGNSSHAFVYAKTEKLASAVHMVTNTISEDEPIRSQIREKSLLLLSDILSLQTNFNSVGKVKENEIILGIVEIMSLIDVTGASGLISPMNKEILKKEYRALTEFLLSKQSVSGGLQIGEGFFAIPKPKQENARAHEWKNEMSNKRQNSTPQQISVEDKNNFVKRDSGLVRQENIKDINNTVSAGHVFRKTAGVVASKHKRRRSAVLELLKVKSNLTVKDVSEVVSGCSEKTLQRELVSMVKEGILRREGERRWSTYSLK